MTSYVLFRAERVEEELPCGVLAQWRHMSCLRLKGLRKSFRVEFSHNDVICLVWGLKGCGRASVWSSRTMTSYVLFGT